MSIKDKIHITQWPTQYFVFYFLFFISILFDSSFVVDTHTHTPRRFEFGCCVFGGVTVSSTLTLFAFYPSRFNGETVHLLTLASFFFFCLLAVLMKLLCVADKLRASECVSE